MPKSIVLTDPRHDAKERHGVLDRLALRYINDERDLPFVRLCAAIVAVLIPLAVYMYLPGRFRWWIGGVYLALAFGLFFDRFILMLHNTSHRALFKKGYRRLNRFIPWVLGPLFGETPETYYAHHIGMHHPEENLPDDLSSTMPYRRDSVLHFLAYWARFFFGILFELALYHARRRRWKLLRMMLIGEVAWYATVGLLLWVNWRATLIVFVVPFLAARFLMMAGNWAQHAFIDPADPANAYKSSIVCINCRYNRRCFNDGYHVGHHEKPNRHWTEMPADFEGKLARYAAEGTVVFEGIDYFVVWAWLMRKRYDKLADHFVDLGDQPRSRDEIIQLLRDRTRPVLQPAPAVTA